MFYGKLYDSTNLKPWMRNLTFVIAVDLSVHCGTLASPGFTLLAQLQHAQGSVNDQDAIISTVLIHKSH